MFDSTTLKPSLKVTPSQVECPVLGCPNTVARQKSRFRCDPVFQCAKHKIFISPSTFEYPREVDNLLWKDLEDIELLRRIKVVKRECRMARDNSEDALSWNVFRYLEKTGHLSQFLSQSIHAPLQDIHLICWSYSLPDNGTWPQLARARLEFGERPEHSSEPDFIAFDDTVLVFIEAKLSATNETDPRDPNDLKKYTTGGNEWYRKVFKSDYSTVAVAARKYELLRYWLLGSWIASVTHREFYLVNLVRSDYEQDIESRFLRHVTTGDSRHFIRLTWEDIHAYVGRHIPPSGDRDLLLQYLKNKTVGYDREGHLQRAFSIS